MRRARSAGTVLAMAVTSNNPDADAISVTGSVADTPYTWPANTRAAAAEPSNPTTAPPRPSAHPLPTTMRTMFAGPAPNAVRMPISFDRCATVYDTTPYVPIAASTRPSTANAPTSTAAYVVPPAAAATTSCIVATSPSAMSGSIDRTMRSTGVANAAGAPLVRTMRILKYELNSGSCRYSPTICGRGGWSNPSFLTSWNTPTIVIGVAVSTATIGFDSVMRAPMGSRLGMSWRANDSLTIATAGPPATSVLRKSRPRTRRVPYVRRYESSATVKNAVGRSAKRSAACPSIETACSHRAAAGGYPIVTVAASTPGNSRRRL